MMGPLFFFLHPDARGDAKGGGHRSKDGNQYVQDFTPKLLVFHV